MRGSRRITILIVCVVTLACIGGILWLSVRVAQPQPHLQVVIVNDTGTVIRSLSVSIAGQAVRVENVPYGESIIVPLGYDEGIGMIEGKVDEHLNIRASWGYSSRSTRPILLRVQPDGTVAPR
jgi:hypothetical protein